MKKLILLAMSLMCILVFAGCVNNDTQTIKITIPAKTTEAVVFSDEEITATNDKITISAGEGLGDTKVTLQSVNQNSKSESTYLTSGFPAKFFAKEGESFKVGVSVKNDTAIDKVVEVKINGANIESEHLAHISCN